MSVDLKDYNLIGQAERLYAARKFELAFSHYQICLTHEPQNPEFLNRAGECLAGQGKYADSFIYLDEAVKVSFRNNPTYLTNLGNCLLHLGKPKEALPYFETALALERDNPLYLAHLAGCQADLGIKAFSSNLKRAFSMANEQKLGPDSLARKTIAMLQAAYEIKI